MSSKYYDVDKVKTKYGIKENDYVTKLNLFRHLRREYFKRTPESDSLYRRRNRLVVLAMSGLFYYKTSNNIFNRIQVEIFSKKSLLPKLSLPILKSFYFISCIFLAQLAIKYLYYLNKVFKSYQFALEVVLKYDIIKKDYVYRECFDIVDSENIKKNQ
jgi:hypothetical protein